MKAQFNLATAYGASPKYGASERDRTVAQSDRGIPFIRRAPTWLWARRYCRTEKFRKRSPSCRKRRGSIPRAAKLITRWDWLWRARDARMRGRQNYREGANSPPRTIATRTSILDIAEGREALDKGDLDQAVRQVSTCHQAPTRIVGCPTLSWERLWRSRADVAGRVRRIPKGCRTQSG